MMIDGHDARLCSVGRTIAEGGLMAEIALQMTGGDAPIEEQLKRDRMYYLILHELGHTLGMNHNMKATQLLSPEELEDPAVLESGIISGSVMDYPAVNYAPNREDQTLFYTIAPGPYDDWYIEYAYSPGLDDADAEAAKTRGYRCALVRTCIGIRERRRRYASSRNRHRSQGQHLRQQLRLHWLCIESDADHA